MKAFSNSLKTWFTLHSFNSLREVAAAADMPATDLSRVRSGDKDITRKALAKLLPAIEQLSSRREARSLLIAYLHDETPPEYQSSVLLQAIEEGTGEVDLDIIAQLGARWVRKARSNTNFAKMWLLQDGLMHEPDAEVVTARILNFEKDIALVAEPVVEYKATKPRGGHPQDVNRLDPMPSQHAAQEHQEP